MNFESAFTHSPAFDAVSSASHPSPECGGPCATCAFRPGSEASQTEHTVVLAKLCIESLTPFQCHEQPRVCRGFIAAVNLRHAAGDIGQDEASKQRRDVQRCAAELIALSISAAAEEEERQHERRSA